MKIVINALPYKKNSSGIGVLIRELFVSYTRGVTRDCQLILSNDSPFGLSYRRNVEVIRAPYQHGQSLKRFFFQSFSMGRKYCQDALLLTTDTKIPFILPKNCKVIPVITDLAVYRMGAVYQRSRTLLWRLQYRYILKRAARYIAISDFTKRELMDIFHISPQQIDVVYCAGNVKPFDGHKEIAISRIRDTYSISAKYILFVGNANPRKNLDRMMQAFDLLKKQSNIPHKLVIAGEPGWKFDRMKALAGLRYTEDIQFLGFVPDEDMPALYAAAELFLFPTLYEGFGIPIIDAQSCGTPVVTSKCSALPEIGGQAAVYVDPEDIDDICAGMRHVLEDPVFKARLIELGRENSKRFSWQTSAKRLQDIVEQVIVQ